MDNINDKTIFFIDKNIHGGIVIYGKYGVKQYYGYSKSQAKKLYLESDHIFTNHKVRNGE